MTHKGLDPLIKGKNEVMRMSCRRVEDIFTGGMERFSPNKRNPFQFSHSLSVLQICIGISFTGTNVLVERIFLVMNDIELMTKQKVSSEREENKKASTVVKMKRLL